VIHYFAYGSNLHPVRLVERIPSARLVGCATLPRYRLQFRQQGEDGSGKCNIEETGRPVGLVHGAIYALEPEHKSILDRFEGEGYSDEPITLRCADRTYDCFTYMAKPAWLVDHLAPYEWYRRLVATGAHHLDFPAAYIAAIESSPAVADPNPERAARHERLIERMAAYTP